MVSMSPWFRMALVTFWPLTKVPFVLPRSSSSSSSLSLSVKRQCTRDTSGVSTTKSARGARPSASNVPGSIRNISPTFPGSTDCRVHMRDAAQCNSNTELVVKTPSERPPHGPHSDLYASVARRRHRRALHHLVSVRHRHDLRAHAG